MKKFVLIFTILISLLVGMVGVSRVQGSSTTLSVQPPSIRDPTMVAGTPFTINVNVTDVIDLYTFEFMLNYSTAVLTATEITVGSFFPPGSWIVYTEINDALGFVGYAVSMPMGSPAGKDGNGTLATVAFTVDGYGGSKLDLCNTVLGNSPPHSQPIPHTAVDGYFSNVILGDVNADGIVDIFDIGAVSAHWYPGPPVGPLGYDPSADINGDGAVDIFDIGIVSAHWGESV